MRIMPHPRIAFLSVVALFALGASTLPARAQPPREQVRALNLQAVEAYHALEIERAVALLDRALVVAEEGGVGGQELARTHATYGIVCVAGLRDNTRASLHFVKALQADPHVVLDPQITTPEINGLFTRARAQLAGEAPAATPPAAGGPEVTAGVHHTPFQEQLMRTPVPIFVGVDASVRVTRAVVRYRSRGMRSFAELALTAMRGGYGIEIPCADVFEPQIEYYVLLFGADNREVGHAGNAERPFVMRIVRTRRFAPPALPGRVPPPQCSEHECPPNLPSCRRDTPGTGVPRAR